MAAQYQTREHPFVNGIFVIGSTHFPNVTMHLEGPYVKRCGAILPKHLEGPFVKRCSAILPNLRSILFLNTARITAPKGDPCRS
jgi:hypothetical protein